MRVKVSVQDNSFVQVVGHIADQNRITDSELGYSYWVVMSETLHRYIPKYLEAPFGECYQLSCECDWHSESLLINFQLGRTILTPGGKPIEVRRAFTHVAPSLAEAVKLPSLRRQWKQKAYSLVCATCELSGNHIDRVAYELAVKFVDSNKVFAEYISL